MRDAQSAVRRSRPADEVDDAYVYPLYGSQITSAQLASPTVNSIVKIEVGRLIDRKQKATHVPQIQAHPRPSHSLLTKYSNAHAYTDCFVTEIARTVSHAEFVEAFYTGGLFKVERFLLRVFIAKPSTDLQARQLAAGELNAFAAWRVEARAVDQLLLCDLGGRTRSWLMVAPSEVPGRTRLYFGSAVVPVTNPSTGERSMGFGFKALLGFHRRYSRALLSAAAARLMRASA